MKHCSYEMNNEKPCFQRPYKNFTKPYPYPDPLRLYHLHPDSDLSFLVSDVLTYFLPFLFHFAVSFIVYNIYLLLN